MALLDIRPILVGYILDDADVAALIVDRFMPTRLDQGERRASVVYRFIGGTGEHTMQGVAGLVHLRLQIDAYAPTSGQALQVANAVKFRLDGLRGRLEGPDSPPTVARVQGVMFASEREELFDEASGLFRKSRDYIIHFEER